MKQFQTLLIAAFLLLPTSRVWAQYDNSELYAADVCNEGQIAVDVATASIDFYPILPGKYWVINRWVHVRPGECKRVFTHTYGKQNLFSFQSFPLHLAFAFTDSTGVWGAAKITKWTGPSPSTASHLQLCVARNDQTYRVEDDDPATECEKSSEGFLIPASIDYEPTSGHDFSNRFEDNSATPKFTVALGPKDRAIPLGPQRSPGAATASPGTFKDLTEILNDAIRGAGAPIPRMSDPNVWLKICVPPSFVEAESWADPESPRARTARYVIRRFITSHDFGNVAPILRLTEDQGTFHVAAVSACSGDFTLSTRGPSDPSATKPAPAVKPAPQPDPGFGDVLGPGGFVVPPKK